MLRSSPLWVAALCLPGDNCWFLRDNFRSTTSLTSSKQNNGWQICDSSILLRNKHFLFLRNKTEHFASWKSAHVFLLIWEQRENKSYLSLYLCKLAEWWHRQDMLNRTHIRQSLDECLFSSIDENWRYPDLQTGLVLGLGALPSRSKARDTGTSLSQTIYFQ